MTPGALPPDPRYTRLIRIKLPGMEIDHRRSFGALEASESPPGQPQGVETEIPSSSHRKPSAAQLEHGQWNFPDALVAPVDTGRRVRDSIAVVAHRENRRVIAVTGSGQRP